MSDIGDKRVLLVWKMDSTLVRDVFLAYVPDPDRRGCEIIMHGDEWWCLKSGDQDTEERQRNAIIQFRPETNDPRTAFWLDKMVVIMPVRSDEIDAARKKVNQAEAELAAVQAKVQLARSGSVIVSPVAQELP